MLMIIASLHVCKHEAFLLLALIFALLMNLRWQTCVRGIVFLNRAYWGPADEVASQFFRLRRRS